MKRYAIHKPNKRDAFCYVTARNQGRALTFARKLFTLPRGTVAVLDKNGCDFVTNVGKDL